MKKYILLISVIFFLAFNNNFVPKEEKIASKDDNLVSIHLLEANLVDAIRLLSAKTGKNILMDGKLKGKITVDLKNVPLEEALRSILDNFGYTFINRGNIYRLVPSSSLKTESKLQRKLFTLEYVSADNIKNLISSILSKEGKVITDAPHNSIIVTDYEQKIREVENYLYKLDIPVPQVFIEARIVETSLGKNDNSKIAWSLVKNYMANDITNKKSLSMTDGGALYGVLSSANLNIILDRLREDTRVKLLSCPNVTTLNNEKAVIEITTTKVVGKEALFDDTGKIKGYTPKTEDIGIKLEVTPFITRNQYINLKVVPSISSAKKSDLFPDEALDVTESKANTSILIKNGETLVIGGLIKEDQESVTKKIPFLSDIPYIGKRLFTHSSKNESKKELTIFVTAKIIHLNTNAFSFKKYY